MMSRQLKINACITFLLAVLFYLFFQICKQQPALAHVNAFANDPYDTVGTAATQFAAFTVLLSMVRVFRPYQPGKVVDSRQVLLIRGAYMTCLAVAVTLGADIVALFRYPSVWMGSTAGNLLVSLIGGMAFLTVLVLWRIHHAAILCMMPSGYQKWIRPLVFSLISIIILAWYPESWHHNLTGELLTVVMGITLFFAVVWAWGMALAPSLETGEEDSIDDFVSIYSWLKVHTGQLSGLLVPVEKTLDSPFIHPIVNWLNPRKYPWNGILLFGICMGAVIAFAETMSEGGVGPHFALLATVFVTIECAGVLIGYMFLAKPLWLFRRASYDKAKL